MGMYVRARDVRVRVFAGKRCSGIGGGVDGSIGFVGRGLDPDRLTADGIYLSPHINVHLHASTSEAHREEFFRDDPLVRKKNR